jgi:hypothetical protein
MGSAVGTTPPHVAACLQVPVDTALGECCRSFNLRSQRWRKAASQQHLAWIRTYLESQLDHQTKIALFSGTSMFMTGVINRDPDGERDGLTGTAAQTRPENTTQ